jgi:RND family efflux transporter MFP subunit
MRKATMAALAALLAAGTAAGLWVAKRGNSGDSVTQEIRTVKTMYNCAMHPQYISDKPGNCPICGMKLTPMDKHPGGASPAAASAGGEGKIAYYRDPMHPWITSDKPGKSPDCGMDMVPVYENDAGGGGGKTVRIDPATVQNMGVKTEPVRKRDLRTEIRSSGKVKVDESKLTLVNARVMGYAEKLRVNVTGQKVAKGQALLDLYSPDLVSTQEEYLQALRYAQGTGGSAETGSRALVESARRRLLNWGISPSEIAKLEKLGHARNTLSIVSPASGVVLEKKVVEGQNVTPGMELYEIADLSKVWVVASIYQRDLAAAKLGAEAEVELSYLPGKAYKGRLAFISPVLDEQTKTAEVRIEVPNTPSLDFKPEMFATVRILAPTRRGVVAIPEQAVIRSGRRNVAIVAVGGGYFEPREVKLGAAADDYVEVIEGLHEGEMLVVSSQFLIDSESNLKAAIQQLQAAPAPDSNAAMEK